MMASFIKKLVCDKEVYYKGREQWTDKFSERKRFTTEADAREEYIRYAGLVVNE